MKFTKKLKKIYINIHNYIENMKKKYAIIQIKTEVHELLKDFCNSHGYKISGLVESLIKEKIKSIQTNKEKLPSIKL